MKMDHNLPDEFKTRMQSQLGDEYPAFLASYDAGKVSALRLNTLKCFKGVNEQAGQDGSPVPWCPTGFYYDEALHPGAHPYHEAGVYYIQDASAMLPAELLSPLPGERVLDLCAAPGGKSTQLAAMLCGGGLLVANEIIPSRAKILSENIERMGITGCIVTNEAPEDLAEKLPGFFDKILVDAPCSGEGMFRKNPEAIQEWSPQNVKMCAQRQSHILAEAAKLLAPGGVIVYSTCTFSPEENEGVVEGFLASHPGFMSTASRRLWPHKVRGEGHFAARIEWDEDDDGEALNQPEMRTKARPRPSMQNENFAAFQSFAAENLSDDFTEKLAGTPISFGDQLYLLPPDAPDISGIKVLRPGLHLGTLKKNRFEPAHALAMALSPRDAKSFVSFPAAGKEIRDYLSGNLVTLSDPAIAQNRGWTLVCVDGYSVGWGKLVGSQLKNHYPKGLRRALPPV